VAVLVLVLRRMQFYRGRASATGGGGGGGGNDTPPPVQEAYAIVEDMRRFVQHMSSLMGEPIGFVEPSANEGEVIFSLTQTRQRVQARYWTEEATKWWGEGGYDLDTYTPPGALRQNIIIKLPRKNAAGAAHRYGSGAAHARGGGRSGGMIWLSPYELIAIALLVSLIFPFVSSRVDRVTLPGNPFGVRVVGTKEAAAAAAAPESPRVKAYHPSQAPGDRYKLNPSRCMPRDPVPPGGTGGEELECDMIHGPDHLGVWVARSGTSSVPVPMGDAEDVDEIAA
jgi:hypothetical protein